MKKMSMLIKILAYMLLIAGCSSEQPDQQIDNLEEKEYYTVEFETNRGSIVDSQIVEAGSTIKVPSVTREGYKLDGWYYYLISGETQTYLKWSFTDNSVNNDLTLYANWTPEKYSITFEVDSESNNRIITRDYGDKIPLIQSPIKEGHTFLGWSPRVPNTMPAENITVTANWEINEYSSTYLIYDDYDLEKAILLKKDESIILVSMGNNFSSLITSTGRVFLWGKNVKNQIGGPNLLYKSIPTDITLEFSLNEGETIASVSLLDETTAALTSMGRLFMSGNNLYGQLGDGTTTSRSNPTDITSGFDLNDGEKIKSVTLGGDRSSILTSTGRMFMWGSNSRGQLGDGTTTSRSNPTDITSKFNLKEVETIVSVSLSSSHSSALTSTGRLYVWGYNRFGQLGDGTIIDKYTPTEITSEFNLDEGETIVSISIADNFSSALTSSGRVFMWGWNRFGQLGDGEGGEEGELNFTSTPKDITSSFNLNENEKIASVSLARHLSSALTSFGRVFMWGNNIFGQLGIKVEYPTFKDVPTDITSEFRLIEEEKIVSVSLGSDHSSALTSSGRLFTWGSNNNGQLGDGTTKGRPNPEEIVPSIYPISTIETVYIFGDLIENPNPTREGYTFDGWYVDSILSSPFDLDKMPSEDLILYGRWIPED